jgi:hypothetical protein
MPGVLVQIIAGVDALHQGCGATGTGSFCERQASGYRLDAAGAWGSAALEAGRQGTKRVGACHMS